jgi:transposase
MGNQRISDDLKEAALCLHACGDSDKEICHITCFSLSTLSHIYRRRRLTGKISRNPAIHPGRPQSLLAANCRYLVALTEHDPTLFLNKYAKCLRKWRYLPTSLTIIHRSFKKAGLSIKQAQKLAAERDLIKQADFVHRIGQYPQVLARYSQLAWDR